MPRPVITTLSCCFLSVPTNFPQPQSNYSSTDYIQSLCLEAYRLQGVSLCIPDRVFQEIVITKKTGVPPSWFAHREAGKAGWKTTGTKLFSNYLLDSGRQAGRIQAANVGYSPLNSEVERYSWVNNPFWIVTYCRPWTALTANFVGPAPVFVASMNELILGESTRTLDERYRLSLPAELADCLANPGDRCILAKQQPGCLSLWNAKQYQQRLDEEINLVESKVRAGKFAGKLDQLQLFGRLLSTRHTEVKLAGRGRLIVPEGFREFLGVERGGVVMVVGAAVCVEIWQPVRWNEHIGAEMPDFRQLLDQLSA